MEDNLAYIRDQLAAATESSVRSRRILVLLIAASILVFIAFWNSRDSSWIRVHLKWAEEIETLISGRPASAGFSPEEQKTIQGRANAYHIENREEAQHFHQHLLDLMAEHVMYVRIPVLGIVFDINDLGVLSGLTFSVTLLWFLFALWHESHNLRLCIDDTNDRDKKTVYRYLAMRQLFTSPPSLRNEERRRLWTILVFVLFALPALTDITVVIDDVTYASELPYTSGLTKELSIEVVCFLVVAILSFLCMRLLWQIDKAWEGFAKDVRPPSPTPQTQG